MFLIFVFISKNKTKIVSLTLIVISIVTVYLFQLSSSFSQKDTEAILGISANSVSASPAFPPQKVSNPTHIKFGIAEKDYRNEFGTLSKLPQSLGSNISTVSIFKQFGLASNNTLNIDDLSYIKSQNIKLMIAWEPWNPQEGMNQSRDYLKEIAESKQDEYIKTFANTIKAYNSPVIIRFGHEMNGEWYPWGNRSADYINAYRRIVTLFKNEGVQNVSWMWSINNEPHHGITSYYPGDEYVDIIGLDGFNWGTSKATSEWTSFDEVFGGIYKTISTTYDKPIIISETASAELGGNKAAWIKDMHDTLTNTMPKVTEVVWFNYLKETDWRIDSSPSSTNAFKEKF